MKTTMVSFIVLLSSTLGLLGSSLAATPAVFAEPDATTRAAVEQAVLETNAQMTAAANRLDADAFFEFIFETEKPLIIQNGLLFKNRAEALATVRRGFRGIAKMDRRFENPRVTVIADDCAVLAAEGSSDATLDDGRRIQSRFVVSMVFVRQRGQWKLLHGHYSTPLPAP
jgi:ketosteroid isomerase-like protein